MGGLAAVPPVSSPRGNIIIVLITVFFCLSLVFLCIRLYTNLYIRRLLTASDWLAVAAFLFNIPLAVCSILGVLYGGCGKHINQLTPAHVANVQKLGVLAQTAYPISLGFTKCSICYLLAIMFPVRSVRIAAITLAVRGRTIPSFTLFPSCERSHRLVEFRCPSGFLQSSICYVAYILLTPC